MTTGNTEGVTQDNTQHKPTDFDFGWDWDNDDFDAPQLRSTNDPALPVTLEDNLIPIDRNDVYVPNHLDDHGMLHFFAPVDISDQPNFDDPLVHLRYFRVVQADDGRRVHDSYPVMPLESDSASPFPLPALQIMLEDGDLENAQELAYQIAQLHGLNFPDPALLPELNTSVDYRFAGGVSEDGSPTLEAIKAWREGDQDREARLIISSYGMSEELTVALGELNELRETQSLQAAMSLAEAMAMAGGYLDPTRADPRLFTDGPSDPFMTERQQELNTLSYAVGAISANGTSFLDVIKSWGEEDYERLVIPQPSWEEAHLQANIIFTLQANDDLQGAMNWVEQAGVAAGVIDPHRDDPRLFTQGPPDRFTTLREAELSGLDAVPIEESNRDITHNNTDELPPVSTPELDSWDALIAAQPDDQPEPERHYWQIHYRPVETPDGERLGTALLLTEFPQIPPDFDGNLTNSMDDSSYPTEARTVEMAHFTNDDDARKFEKEFRSYLVPELLDGPELAPEVAKLEGLSGEWEEMNQDQITDYMSGNRTIVREESDWHLYNPNAERDARIVADELYIDPMQQTIVGSNAEQEIETPDFDL